MLHNAGLPSDYWCYAMAQAGYLGNLLPHSVLNGKTPTESRDGKVQDYSHLRVWGCPAFVGQRRRQRTGKWEYRSKEGIYVGYHQENQTHVVRFPDGKHADTTDMEFNELFDPTYLPRGLMTDHDSYQHRDEEGKPRLVHQVNGNPFKVPVIYPAADHVQGSDRTTYEVEKLKRKKPVKTNGDSPQPFTQSPVRQDSFDEIPFDWEPQEFSVDGDKTSPKFVRETRNQESPKFVREARNQESPKFVREARNLESPKLKNQESPKFVREARNQKSPETRESRLEQGRNETPEAKRFKTKSGRKSVAATKFAPEAASYQQQKQEQKSTLGIEQADWDARKARDHAVRDENAKPPTPEPVRDPATSAVPQEPVEPATTMEDYDEAAEFCNANKYYKMLYEESTSGTREFMMSAATRPEKGEVGSVEEKVLWVKDPKQQKHIEAMDEWNKKRFNDSTAAEKNGFFQDPKIAQRIRITDVPAGATIMNTMCIWVTKFLQGKYEKTKARIVVRGDQAPQTGENTFAPTVRFTSMLTLFCLAAMYNWRVDKIDYTGAFLNAELPEAMYARFPHGLKEWDADGTEMVIVFHRAAYGISTAPRLWNLTQDKEYRSLGYYQHKTDSCVYSQSFGQPKESTGKKLLKKLYQKKKNGFSETASVSQKFNPEDFGILGNHVDDGAFFTPNEQVASREKKRFFRKYAGTDEGLLTNFCGIRVDQHANGIDLDQEAYIDSLAVRHRCVDCKPVHCPIEKKIEILHCPEPDDVDKNIQRQFWTINGELMYLCTHTRPDLSYALNQLTSVAHRPHALHLAQAHHLLRYVVTTKHYKMKFHRSKNLQLRGYNFMDASNFEMQGYADSSYADCKATARSSAGHVYFLGPNQACVEAIAKKLPDVGNSSTENEYITLSRCASSGYYIKQFVDELGLFDKPVRFMIYEDNSATLNALKKNVATSKYRHLRARWHYLRDMVNEKTVEVHKIHTDDQVADIFSKPLYGLKLQKFTAQMLGHLPRDHEDGELVNMDYQPEMEPYVPVVEIKSSYAKILKQVLLPDD